MCRLSHISGHFRLNLSDHERVNFGCSNMSKNTMQRYDSIDGNNLTLQKLRKLCFKIFELTDYQQVTKFCLQIIVLFIGHKNKRTFD